jgi:DNA-binding beta-propeller fold protein YncE
MDRLRFTLRLLPGALAAAAFVAACGGGGSLKEPTSDNNYDDPCDPGGGGGGGSGPPADGGILVIALPGAPPGIGLDDLRFSGDISKVLIPAGRTGNLDLLDPSTGMLTSVDGFTSSPTYSGDATQGATSADEGNGLVYVVDRTSKKLSVVDPKGLAIKQSVALAAVPDLVRYVPSTMEVWVTEPASQQIEVFTLPADPTKSPPVSVKTIPVSGGPEGLAIDSDGDRAYTSSTASTTYSIDIAKRAVAQQWANGCGTTRDIVVDPSRKLFVVGCDEGQIIVLAIPGGATLGSATVGAGLDELAYDPSRGRVYAQSPTAGSMAVVDLTATGSTTLRGSIGTAMGGRGAVATGGGSVYVGNPALGQLLLIRDPF